MFVLFVGFRRRREVITGRGDYYLGRIFEKK